MMIPRTDIEKLEYAMGQLDKAKAYFESSLRIAETYIEEVIKEQEKRSKKG